MMLKDKRAFLKMELQVSGTRHRLPVAGIAAMP